MAKHYLDTEGLEDYTGKLTTKYKTIFASKTDVGTPLVAATAAAMTDTTKIYVYTGSETGYTAGNWYYYNGSAWVSGGIYNSTAVETDTTLSEPGMAADAKATGDAIEETNTDITDLKNAIEYKKIQITHLYNGSTQNSGNTTAIHTGGYSNIAGLIPVSEGDTIDFLPMKPLSNSAYYVFGYTTYSTNTTSPTSIRNINYNSGTTHDTLFPLTIGNGEHYLGITIAAYDSGGNAVTLRNTDFTVNDFLLYWSQSDEQIFQNKSVEVIRPTVIIRNGSDGNTSNTTDVHIGGLSIVGERPFLIPVEEGDLVQLVVTKPVQNSGNRYGYSARIGNASYSVTRHFGLTDIGVSLDQLIRVKSGEKYIAYTIRELKADGTTATLRANQVQSPQVGVFIYRGKNVINVLDNKLSMVSKYVAQTPLLRNGSLGNSSNENAICMTYNLPSFGAESVCMHWDIDFQGADPQFIMKTYSVYTETQQTSDATNQIANYANEIPSDLIKKISDKDYIVSIDGCAAFSFGVFDRDGNSYYPLRTSKYQGVLTVTYNYGSIAESGFGYEVLNKINTSRKLSQTATNNGLKPLTLLHFSDIHDDKVAFARIEQYADFYSEIIDDVICTGDITGNSGGQTGASLVDWWNPNYLTCVGNHDSATYNSSAMTYNWTGVSMAQRDAYYIAPFESNWGIVHTPGTSYYYKDYADAKVRLIVVDCMLYHGTPGTEATTQTAWIGTTMDGAKELGYHVLIAIHAPRTGATYKDCTFNRYGYTGAYPSFPDGVETPRAVSDMVASKITGGCVFIGYIIGHTHQDYMLDINNDGKQMMYCVTCAAVTQTAQWQGSDQWRDSHADAFNVVTVDTDARMVKIVRGGGANVDNRMRNRTQICFHYGDGVIVGQDN